MEHDVAGQVWGSGPKPESYSDKEKQSGGEQRHCQVLGPVISAFRTVNTLWVVGVERRRGSILTLATQLTGSTHIVTHTTGSASE